MLSVAFTRCHSAAARFVCFVNHNSAPLLINSDDEQTNTESIYSRTLIRTDQQLVGYSCYFEVQRRKGHTNTMLLIQSGLHGETVSPLLEERWLTVRDSGALASAELFYRRSLHARSHPDPLQKSRPKKGFIII